MTIYMKKFKQIRTTFDTHLLLTIKYYSNVKALSTSTSALCVWVIEYKLTLDLIIDKVHLCANHEH